MAVQDEVTAERQRIERDLHDGAQQHLIALQIRLVLAAEQFAECGEAEAAAVLRAFSEEVEEVTNQVRDLARGIYPASLTSAGLASALAAAGASGRGVTLRASGIRRCRPEVEIAVYFTCLAALDNVARHAGPVPVSVELTDGGPLDFTVRDEGVGFDLATTRVGAGITNMRNRIAAVGGTLTVESAPGSGTQVRGSVPDPGWR